MGKILVLWAKHGDMYFDASTPELELEAFLKAFNYNDRQDFYKEYLANNQQNDLYFKAINGDKLAARLLMTLRKDYEYEGFSIEEVR